MNWVRARAGLVRALTGVITACCLILVGLPSAVAEDVPAPPPPSGLQRGIDDALPRHHCLPHPHRPSASYRRNWPPCGTRCSPRRRVTRFSTPGRPEWTGWPPVR